jgi:predicted nucleotidyltransferase
LTSALRRRFGPRLRQVTIFGSQARGEADADSDVDVFVLIDGLGARERIEVFESAADVSLERLVSLQVLAPLPDEHAWLVRNECRILRDIEAEGRSL